MSGIGIIFVICKRIFVTYLPKWLWVPLRSKQMPLYMSQWHFKCNDRTTQILFCTFSYDNGLLDDNIFYNLTRTLFERNHISFACVYFIDALLKPSTWRPMSSEQIKKIHDIKSILETIWNHQTFTITA